jgi:hypothetical protein
MDTESVNQVLLWRNDLFFLLVFAALSNKSEYQNDRYHQSDVNSNIE